jgi:hypothetical protein
MLSGVALDLISLRLCESYGLRIDRAMDLLCLPYVLYGQSVQCVGHWPRQFVSE